ncbi:MAG: histidine--tRNA ligase [Cyanobacteria bacterium P01_G01_bin.39]
MKQDKDLNYNLPSGFDIELIPSEKRLELHLLNIISTVFESYGFTPIETPAVERLEILQAKGNQGDNIIYEINPIVTSSEDDESKPGKSDRGLKFDQTVPLAAYIARHLNDLVFPFSRYQMDMVFRGERAKKGRYRQFRQCDIDVIGRQDLSIFYDAQMPAIIAEIFSRINIGEFIIRINNKKILQGLFEFFEVEAEKIKLCIQTIDTLEKVGKQRVKQDLQLQGLSEEQSGQIISFIELKGTVDEVLNFLKQKSSIIEKSSIFAAGVSELQSVIDGIRKLNVPETQYCIDLSIARGLNYYTGTIYETTLIDHESIGSICSGGRYDNLVGMFVGERMPGVGISIGLTRLLRKLLDNNILAPMSANPAQVMVLNLEEELIGFYLEISKKMRDQGIRVLTEFKSIKIGKQLKKADKLGISICLIIGSEEYKNNSCRIKMLKTGEQIDTSIDNLNDELQKRLKLN